MALTVEFSTVRQTSNTNTDTNKQTHSIIVWKLITLSSHRLPQWNVVHQWRETWLENLITVFADSRLEC